MRVCAPSLPPFQVGDAIQRRRTESGQWPGAPRRPCWLTGTPRARATTAGNCRAFQVEFSSSLSLRVLTHVDQRERESLCVCAAGPHRARTRASARAQAQPQRHIPCDTIRIENHPFRQRCRRIASSGFPRAGEYKSRKRKYSPFFADALGAIPKRVSAWMSERAHFRFLPRRSDEPEKPCC